MFFLLYSSSIVSSISTSSAVIFVHVIHVCNPDFTLLLKPNFTLLFKPSYNLPVIHFCISISVCPNLFSLPAPTTVCLSLCPFVLHLSQPYHHSLSHQNQKSQNGLAFLSPSSFPFSSILYPLSGSIDFFYKVLGIHPFPPVVRHSSTFPLLRFNLNHSKYFPDTH